jgi:hypothetical protein
VGSTYGLTLWFICICEGVCWEDQGVPKGLHDKSVPSRSKYYYQDGELIWSSHHTYTCVVNINKSNQSKYRQFNRGCQKGVRAKLGQCHKRDTRPLTLDLLQVVTNAYSCTSPAPGADLTRIIVHYTVEQWTSSYHIASISPCDLVVDTFHGCCLLMISVAYDFS